MNKKNLYKNNQDNSKSLSSINFKSSGISSDEEYKTASETSNASNTSHEFADIYELGNTQNLTIA